MAKKRSVVKRVVTYRPIERHWYRIADYVQSVWSRFVSHWPGRFLVWFVAVFLWFVLRVVIRTVLFLTTAMVIIGCGIVYFGFQFALGNTKSAKAWSKAMK